MNDQQQPPSPAPAGTEQSEVIGKKTAAYFQITIRTTPDRVKLFIDCEKTEAGRGHKVTPEMILAELAEYIEPEKVAGPVIDDTARALSEGKPVQKRRIYQGKAPVNGSDGKLDLLVRKVIIPKDRGTGDMDTRFVRGIQNVVKGTVIGKTEPPTEGQEGSDAFGQTVKARSGKPLKLSHANTIVVKGSPENNEKQTLVAEAMGLLTEEAGRLMLKDHLEIGGNVDFTSGPVDFVGNVTISGDVMKDFNVTARENILIEGGVHGGSLVSTTGNITVKGFVNGDRQYRIESVGNFSAGLVENVYGDIVGDIVIATQVRDSHLKTYGKVMMPAAHLFGGMTTGLLGVEAAKIGSPGGSKTIINALGGEVESEISKYTIELVSHEEALKNTRTKIRPFLEDPGRLAAVGNNDCAKINKLLLELDRMEAHKAKLAKILITLKQYLQERPPFRVSYHEALYRGTVITVGGQTFTPDADLTGPGTIEYRADTREFKVGQFKSLKKTKQQTADSQRE